MSQPTKLRCYAYVNRPYDRVRAALHQRGSTLYQEATRAASARADALASTLRVGVAGFEVGVDVHLQIYAVNDEESVALRAPVTRVELGWQAAHATSFFPAMDAKVSAWPLSATETQIELEGVYKPPMGTVGQAVDAVVGHRIAEATAHRFVEDVVDQLRREIRQV